MMQLTELQKQPYENEVALRTQASISLSFLEYSLMDCNNTVMLRAYTKKKITY